MARSYDHVLFDLDGTLIDSASCIVASLELAFAEHGLPVPQRERIVHLMGVPLERSMGMLDARCEDAALREAMIATYRAHYARLSPTLVTAFVGIVALVREIKDHGARTAIVTSKKFGPAHMNLRQVGLDAHIDVVIGSDMVSAYKPDPETALRALRELGALDGARALVVGDASFDIDMGKHAGCDTCAVGWGAHDPASLATLRPTHLVRDITQLRGVLLAR
jgi:phosphoglycolate phosphatase